MNPWPVLLVLAGLLVIGGVLALVLLNRNDKSPTSGGSTGGGAVPHLKAVTAYDPYGSGGEHDADAGLATDGNGSTYWTTERYNTAPSLGKPGVGLVLDAGKDVQLHQIGLATSTPGFNAVIKAGDSTSSFPDTVSSPQTVSTEARFDISGGRHRYYLIWITRLGDAYNTARINEVDAS